MSSLIQRRYPGFLKNDLESIRTVDIDRTTRRRRACQVQRLLAANSRRGRKIADLLVAAAAEQGGHTVLRYDADFDLIASATGQPGQWVAPPGSVA